MDALRRTYFTLALVGLSAVAASASAEIIPSLDPGNRVQTIPTGDGTFEVRLAGRTVAWFGTRRPAVDDGGRNPESITSLNLEHLSFASSRGLIRGWHNPWTPPTEEERAEMLREIDAPDAAGNGAQIAVGHSSGEDTLNPRSLRSPESSR